MKENKKKEEMEIIYITCAKEIEQTISWIAEQCRISKECLDNTTSIKGIKDKLEEVNRIKWNFYSTLLRNIDSTHYSCIFCRLNNCQTEDVSICENCSLGDEVGICNNDYSAYSLYRNAINQAAGFSTEISQVKIIKEIEDE